MHNILIKYVDTPAGVLKVHLHQQGICGAVFQDSVGHSIEILDHTSKIDVQGTPFQQKVWRATMQIPAGATMTYQGLAVAIGQPKAFRAVAHALAQNKIAYFIPCHRVIRKNGELGGYKWGIEKKKMLLEAEKTKK